MSIEKIIYAIKCYRPDCEAISQEIQTLHAHILSLGLSTSVFESSKNDRSNALNFILNLLKHWDFARKLRACDSIVHVFATSRMRFFDLLFKGVKKKIITLIDSDNLTEKHVRRFINNYSFLVTESNSDYERILMLGGTPEKVVLIPPFSKFENDYNPVNNAPAFCNNTINILMASMPFHCGEIERRGIDIIFDVAIKFKNNVEFTLLCRNQSNYTEIKKILSNRKISNIRLIKPESVNVKKELEYSHGMIYPFRYNVKSNPNSLLESLSMGRPVFVSNIIGLSKIIKVENCGMVFDPKKNDAIICFKKFINNYFELQKNARNTYDKYFSKSFFVKKYMELYSNY